MKADRVHFDPRLRGLEALGVRDVAQLLDPEAWPHARAELLEQDSHRTRIRFPLPAEPDESGRFRAEPEGGAGGGWVVLERWRGAPLRRLLAARLSEPRSASLAERTWNVLCHLRAHGVATPEPLAVGARGRGLFSRDSFLVTREARGFEPLTDLLAEATDERRRRALDAVGATLGLLLDARVILPGLRAENLLVSSVDADEEPGAEESCALTQIAEARTSSALGRLRRNRLPSVLLAEVEGGELRARIAPEDLIPMWTGLREGLSRLSTRGERARIFLRATSGRLDRSERLALGAHLGRRAS